MKPSSDPPGLEGRRILVTAGPTWVPIDAVRHLGNRSSGSTGLTIARRLAGAGAGVTLLFGPGTTRPDDSDRALLNIRDFETFDDLHSLMREELRTRSFDSVIHAAAVSDYRPIESHAEKLSSDQEELILRLVRTPKLVDEIKDLDADLLLVKFKLEVGRTSEALVELARAGMKRSRADLVVANDLSEMCDGRHQAFLMDETETIAEVGTNEALAAALERELSRRLAVRPFRSGNQ